jgi:DNA polymerase-3 subunit alpha
LIHKFTTTLPLEEIDKSMVDGLTDICQKYPGNSDLYIKIQDKGMNMSIDMLSRPVKVAVGKELISYLDQYENISYGIN